MDVHTGTCMHGCENRCVHVWELHIHMGGNVIETGGWATLDFSVMSELLII